MEFFRILWRMLHPFHWPFYRFMLVVLAYEALLTVNSYVLSLVILMIEQQGKQPSWLFWLVGGGILLFDEIFVRVDNQADWRIVSQLNIPVYTHLKIHPLAKFLRMDVAWHQTQQSGSLVGEAHHGTDKISNMVDAVCWEFGPTLVQMALSLIPLVWLSPFSALILLLALAVYWTLAILQHQQQDPLRQERHAAYKVEWGKTHEAVLFAETVALYNQQSRFSQMVQDILAQIESLGQQEAQIWVYRFGRWRMRVMTLARRAVLLLFAYQVVTGSLSIASLVFLWTLVERLVHAFWRIAHLYDRANQSLEAARKVEGLLGKEPSIQDPAEPVPIPAGPVKITFDSVTFSYNGSKEGIFNLSLEIPAGQMVALVGPSGAGKTTIARLLSRSWEVNKGCILINGVDIRRVSLEELRRCSVRVHQSEEVAVFNESFFFNIAFGIPDASPEEVTRAARIAGLHDFILGCEQGYDTLLGERGLRLSGGQKQRLAIARAVMMLLLGGARILILDEATSSVDRATEERIQRELLSILGNDSYTVLVIAHDFSTIQEVDRILVLDQGQLVEDGTHEELLAQDGLYADLFYRQNPHLQERAHLEPSG